MPYLGPQRCQRKLGQDGEQLCVKPRNKSYLTSPTPQQYLAFATDTASLPQTLPEELIRLKLTANCFAASSLLVARRSHIPLHATQLMRSHAECQRIRAAYLV